MFLETLKIKGYRLFNDEFTVTLTKGLNVLVGENASGKSSIIDAIRLILLEDEFGRTGISSDDFHRSLGQPSKRKGVDKISLRCIFDDLSSDEQVAYLPWLDLNNSQRAILNLAVENKEDNRGRFKRKIWGNESESAIFEWELLNRINCIYLPPLRDAEEKLKAYKGSRLARLMKNLRALDDNHETHPLEKKFALLNKDLLNDDSVRKANKYIKDNIIQSVGSVFGQDASLQFSEVNFDRIVERIRLLFYPRLPKKGDSIDLGMYRELSENSLGFNNILYLATVLAEFEGTSRPETFHKVLLIEEPEAHLHPQLQIRLLQYLEQKARESRIQIIVTTHSPVIASCPDLNTIKVISIVKDQENPVYSAINECSLGDSKDFLERWLDITKSTLLFAKGVLLVEGIAEALIIKEVAKIVLKNLSNPETQVYHNDLEEYGISIINMNGKFFHHFFALFRGYTFTETELQKCAGIPVKCAGLIDSDPPPGEKPTTEFPSTGANSQLKLIGELSSYSKNCRLFANLKTFEYDLALEGANLKPMAEVLLQFVKTDGPIKGQLEQYITTDWLNTSPSKKADAASWLLDHIYSKGEYAQALARKIATESLPLAVPSYIISAIQWLVSDVSE